MKRIRTDTLKNQKVYPLLLCEDNRNVFIVGVSLFYFNPHVKPHLLGWRWGVVLSCFTYLILYGLVLPRDAIATKATITTTANNPMITHIITDEDNPAEGVVAVFGRTGVV